MKKHAFKYLPWTPEGKLERKFQRDTAGRQEDEARAAQREQEREDRSDAPVSRRELLAALEHVRKNAGCNSSSDHWDAIEMTFRDLIGELE